MKDHTMRSTVIEYELSDAQQTIKELVALCDELRQPLNNTRYHDLYVKACNILNAMEEQGKI